jgi:CO/xanthine dehydrogenase Mo-binding subunit
LLPAFNDPTFFAHAALVAVDRATGRVVVRKVAAVHDSGRIVNPVGAEGQVEGAVVHGVGLALHERTEYANGQQLNPHLLDYKLQTAADAPEILIDFVERPGSDGPFGAKGLGEAPMVPTAAAVANAIADATGARVRELPMTAERVWNSMRTIRDWSE